MFDCIIQPIFKDVTYMLMKLDSQEAIGMEVKFHELHETAFTTLLLPQCDLFVSKKYI